MFQSGLLRRRASELAARKSSSAFLTHSRVLAFIHQLAMPQNVRNESIATGESPCHLPGRAHYYVHGKRSPHPLPDRGRLAHIAPAPRQRHHDEDIHIGVFVGRAVRVRTEKKYLVRPKFAGHALAPFNDVLPSDHRNQIIRPESNRALPSWQSSLRPNSRSRRFWSRSRPPSQSPASLDQCACARPRQFVRASGRRSSFPTPPGAPWSGPRSAKSQAGRPAPCPSSGRLCALANIPAGRCPIPPASHRRAAGGPVPPERPGGGG